MESLNLIELNLLSIDDKNNLDAILLFNRDIYNYLIDHIKFNYLLIIFTIGCFSSLFCYQTKQKMRKHKYIMVAQEDSIPEAKIITNDSK